MKKARYLATSALISFGCLSSVTHGFPWLHSTKHIYNVKNTSTLNLHFKGFTSILSLSPESTLTDPSPLVISFAQLNGPKST